MILPERDMGIKAAKNFASNQFFDMIEISSDYSIIAIAPPAVWVGRKIGELAVRTKFGVNIIAIKNGQDINVMPSANTIINEEDTVTVMGHNSDLNKLQNMRKG